MLNIDKIRKEIEDIGYMATEELLYDTFNALYLFNSDKKNPGQDIYSICLEGPPGAGKTEYAKMYTKLSNMYFNDNVELIEYQCDATTGKTELFEDVNMSAAIRHDAENVNIPGKLVKAINAVNEGKKVVLFIDEYDKAREETDAFLLQFLQDGKINTNQHGDLKINEEYKNNLQVIFCKNDMREELSGPLSRRVRRCKLDYMKPETLYKIANRVLRDEREDKVDRNLLNLVTLMYQFAYNEREFYNRLPSCSEILIALQDSDRIIKYANAPQYIVYHTIIKNMFKSDDDMSTFEGNLKNSSDEKYKKLYELLDSMKQSTPPENNLDLYSLITENLFSRELGELKTKTEEMKKLIEEYSKKFSEMESKRAKVIEKEINEIKLMNGSLVPATKPEATKLFEDESKYIKRGFDIFEISDGEWTDVGYINFPTLSQQLLVEALIKYAPALDIKIYENGVLLKDDGELKLIVVGCYDDDNVFKYRVMSNYPVIPSTYLKDFDNLVRFMEDVLNNRPKINNSTGNNTGTTSNSYSVNALVYNDSKINFEEIRDNVYNVNLSGTVTGVTELYAFTLLATCSDINNAIKVSNKILNKKVKSLGDE